MVVLVLMLLIILLLMLLLFIGQELTDQSIAAQLSLHRTNNLLVVEEQTVQTLQAALDVDADRAMEHLQESLDARQESLNARKQLGMTKIEENAPVILMGVLGIVVHQ